MTEIDGAYRVSGAKGGKARADDGEQPGTEIEISEEMNTGHLNQTEDTYAQSEIQNEAWRLQDVPQPIKLAEIMYALISLSRARLLAKIMGGVMRPASMARECWSPVVMATTMGSSLSSE